MLNLIFIIAALVFSYERLEKYVYKLILLRSKNEPMFKRFLLNENLRSNKLKGLLSGQTFEKVIWKDLIKYLKESEDKLYLKIQWIYIIKQFCLILFLMLAITGLFFRENLSLK